MFLIVDSIHPRPQGAGFSAMFSIKNGMDRQQLRYLDKDTSSTRYFAKKLRQEPLQKLEIAVLLSGFLAIVLLVVTISLNRAYTEDRTILEWINKGVLVILLALFVGLILLVRRNRIAIEAKNAALGTRILEKTARLAETMALNSAIVENASDGIITINQTGIVQTVNSATEKMFGYTRNEVIGRNVAILMPSPYCEKHDSYISNYLMTGMAKVIGTPGYDVVGQRKDGSVFSIEITINEVRIENQRIFTGILRDVTERKKVDRMKDEFISVVSHELRTPLTSIRGSLGLLVHGVAGALLPQAKQLMTIALNNTERLIRLINDILDIQKIQAGQMVFQAQPMELMPLLQQAIAVNHSYGEQLGVTFVLISQLPGVQVSVDSDRFLQVMANLLSNAAKFSHSGDSVEIAASVKDTCVQLSVSDHGCGIPEEFRKRIFEKFAQADSSDTRQKGGSGLGLSICKAILEKMGGRIYFESVVNVGTTFYFDVPLASPNVVMP
jgi:PAS domain S-box-containing protein